MKHVVGAFARGLRPLAGGVVVVWLLAGGCATGGHLTREQALERHTGLGQLQSELAAAEAAGVPDLAPDGYREAASLGDTALTEAEKGRAGAAEQHIKEGLARLARARADADTAKDALGDVLSARERARKAGAPALFTIDLADADERLHDLARLVERGRVEDAKNRRVTLIDTYLSLELASLKKGTDQAAEAALGRARAVGAERHAPKTLKRAEDELAVARSVLEADREDRERADAHARRAIALAERATQITEVVKDFDRLDYSPEDVVLWYQGHLAAVVAPLGDGEPPFDRPDREVVKELTDRVAEAAKSSTELKAELEKASSRYEDLLKSESAQRQKVEQAERENRERFDRVQALFTPEEADVFRQRQNVLIAAHGFWFPSGGSEIDAVNFGLLNKIVKAIREFPQARIAVMGHTDAAGDADVNLALSQERARKVARFLVDVGGVEARRVTAQGFGETRPVASNDTKEGRAANRRVEILIINE
jgi:OOP family OmpA-OmpF porin